MNPTHHRRDERGLALLDVLLTMAIFYLIIYIWVANFSSQLAKGRISTVSAEAESVALALNQYKTNTGAVPEVGGGSGVTRYIGAPAVSATDLGSLTATLSPGTSVMNYNPNTTNTTPPGGGEMVGPYQLYSFCLVHRDADGAIDAWASYNSLSARITATGRDSSDVSGHCAGVS